MSVLCGWWTPSALLFLLRPCENKHIYIFPCIRAVVVQVVRGKKAALYGQDLFSKLFFRDTSLKCVLWLLSLIRMCFQLLS